MRDAWVTRMRILPTTVVSTTLEGPLDWPDATFVSGDAVDVVTRLKEESEVPLRSHGSLSMNRALMAAGLVDRVQVTLFPVITGQTGLDPIFQGAADFDLELIESRTLDGQYPRAHLPAHPARLSPFGSRRTWARITTTRPMRRWRNGEPFVNINITLDGVIQANGGPTEQDGDYEYAAGSVLRDPESGHRWWRTSRHSTHCCGAHDVRHLPPVLAGPGRRDRAGLQPGPQVRRVSRHAGAVLGHQHAAHRRGRRGS